METENSFDKTEPTMDGSDQNDHRLVITARAIRMAAAEIAAGRAKAEEVAENPRAALSGKMEFIILKRYETTSQEPPHILIPVKSFRMMKAAGNAWAQGDVKFWKDVKARGAEYAILEDRYEQSVAQLLTQGRIKIANTIVSEVPVERWAYYVELNTVGSGTYGERVVSVF
jgi:hypothetical protein